MQPITVLIVDDSALIRHLFTEMLSGDPGIKVVGTAIDPLDAREKIKQLNPDVLTLDIEMPKMDGLAFLEKIMTLRPMPVIMASTLTQNGAAETIRALELGAVEYISKPTGMRLDDGLEHLKAELISKVHIAARANIGTRAVTTKTSTALAYTPHAAAPQIIAIGSSTGGVEALRDVFARLPGNLPPIVMTQHMPATFTPSFAARLDSLSPITVAEARQGQRLLPGHAYLAPGNQHLHIARSGTEFIARLDENPPVSGHRPSVDVLFDSVAHYAGGNAVGVILTGMGKDGANGLLKMREQGAQTIGQNQASCVVYGMPKAAMAIGAVAIETALSDIPAQIVAACQNRRRAHASL